MKEIGRKTQALRELVDTLDIIYSKELSEPETKDRRENREACWKRRLPVKSLGLLNEAVELVVLPYGDTHGNTSQLLGFLGQLDTTLLDADSYGSVLYTNYSWNGNMAITILMDSAKINNLAMKLAIMPEVDKVEEELPEIGILPGYAKKFKALPASTIKPIKRFSITLRESILAEHELELVPVLA